MRIYREIISSGIKCLGPIEESLDLKRCYLCYVFDCSKSWNSGRLYQGYGVRRPGVYEVVKWLKINGKVVITLEDIVPFIYE